MHDSDESSADFRGLGAAQVTRECDTISPNPADTRPKWIRLNEGSFKALHDHHLQLKSTRNIVSSHGLSQSSGAHYQQRTALSSEICLN